MTVALADLLARLADDFAVPGAHDAAHRGLPADVASLRRAAVLVPLVARPHGVTILLTERTAHLQDHAGQISFPGGRLEAEDADAVAAALREAEEEIGLARRHVEILGRFEEYGTVTGYRVTPVVGLVRPPFDLVPDATEVAEIFELPLDFVLEPTNLRRARERRGGVERDIYEIAYGKWRVWGFTARILVRLIAALEPPAAAPLAPTAEPR